MVNVSPQNLTAGNCFDVVVGIRGYNSNFIHCTNSDFLIG